MLTHGLKIAGLTVALEFSGQAPEFQGAHADFACELSAQELHNADLRLNVRVVAKLNTFADDDVGIVFDAGGVWRLLRRRASNDEILEIFDRSQPHQLPSLRLIYDLKKKTGVCEVASNIYGVGETVSPMFYPADELLWIQLLAENNGLLLHAFSCVLGNGAYAFAGTSGAGKTTLARLFRKNFPALTILSDERVVVRRDEDQLMVFGTPWHGDGREWSAEQAPLKGVFLIEHGAENRAQRISDADAASLLLVRSFPALYKAQPMGRTLDLLVNLIREVPVYRLAVVPDENLFEFLHQQLGVPLPCSLELSEFAGEALYL